MFYRPRMATLEHADVCWLALIAAGLTIDAILLHNGLSPLTESARRHKYVTGTALALLIAHFVDVLGPADPFRLLAGHIR